MGSCCSCTSRSSELARSSALFHYAVSEEHELLSSRNTTLPDLSSFVPNTYAPLPVETPSGNQYSPTQPVEDLFPANILQSQIKNLKESDEKPETADVDFGSSKEDVHEKIDLLKTSTDPPILFQDEEDVCPTCLEEYDAENPKIETKCDHHFHLACILEWMERSNTCPVCDQEMIYSTAALVL